MISLSAARRTIAALAALPLALSLAACSSSSSGLTTASVSPPPAPAEAPPTPATPLQRAQHAAQVTTEAVRCGFQVDAQRLRAAYLASEQASGLQPAELQNVEKGYDLGVRLARVRIEQGENVCAETRLERLREDVKKQLAGDFSAPARPTRVAEAKKAGGLWDSVWDSSPYTAKPLDAEQVFDSARRASGRN